MRLSIGEVVIIREIVIIREVVMIRQAVSPICKIGSLISGYITPRNNIIQSKPIAININEDLQSWLNDDKMITEATLPENFRCIISGPSECGKTFLLRKLILARIYFDKLYIIGPTGDQYEGVERINQKADVEFVKEIKDLSSPDQLQKDLKKLMIFDDVRAKEPVLMNTFVGVDIIIAI